ncbi:MAG: hypothetical protein MI867_11375 [Pseudomonadales bacterium]|nr:hypothetical protein [Pseudomonadales bacterium]
MASTGRDLKITLVNKGKDGVVIDFDVRLSFIDKMKILFFRDMHFKLNGDREVTFDEEL